MALHTPGTYPAKIIDYSVWKGKTGPMAAVMFNYMTPDGETKNITWFGSFNGGAREITVNTLISMDFAGKNGAELNKGKGSGVLNEDKEFEIVIGNEEYQGKVRSKVKFINLPGGSAFRDKMNNDEANVLMGGLNLAGDFAAARSKNKPIPQAPMMQQNFASEEDIPF